MRLIAFDLDGTLIDSREDIARSANFALEAVGLPRRPDDEVLRFVGGGARNLVARCVEPHVERLEDALAAWHRHYAAHLLDHTRPYPGIAAMLAELPGPLAVATNKPGAYARRLCDALFPGRFVAVIGGDEAPRKPDPEMLRRLRERTGAVELIFVGDMELDRRTAEAAGASFVGVGWGFGALPPGTRVAASPAELLAALRAP